MAASDITNQKMFSIVVATYNCGSKIEDTLRSILSQNRESFELIVIDGASTDETLDYIKKYESDLTLISETDAGVYDAFNKGIDLAAGKYIYFIGAGDCLRTGVLEQVAKFLPPEIPALVYGDCYLMKRKIVYKGRESDSFNFITDNICHQAIFYHRSMFDIVGKYDLRYKVFADWFFNLQCFTDGRISRRYIPCIVADFEEGGLSSALDNDPAFKKDFPLLVKKKLGVASYLKCRAFMTNPDVYSFGYNALRAAQRHLVSLARPSVHGYRRLKKAVRNKN